MKLHIQTAILTALNKVVAGWITEHKFHPTRRWRLDFAHEGLKIGVEINGGVWTRGRHVRGKGYLGDLEKSNQAQLLGWTYLQYAPNQLAEMIRDVKALV